MKVDYTQIEIRRANERTEKIACKSRLIQFKIVRITFARDWSNYHRRLCCCVCFVVLRFPCTQNLKKTNIAPRIRKQEGKTEQTKIRTKFMFFGIVSWKRTTSSSPKKWKKLNKEETVENFVKVKLCKMRKFVLFPFVWMKTHAHNTFVWGSWNEVRSARSPRLTFTANCGWRWPSAWIGRIPFSAICVRNAIELHPCASANSLDAVVRYKVKRVKACVLSLPLCAIASSRG